MSKCFPDPPHMSIKTIKPKLDLTSCKTNDDVKKATSVDTSKLAKTTDLIFY